MSAPLPNDSMLQHLVSSMNKGVRFDGRRLTDYRPVKIEYGVSKTAEGSARVKVGDTEVIAGVKLFIDKPYPDMPEDGSLMVGAELLPMASPEFEAGPPDVKSIELARVVDRGIREAKAIDTKKLCIKIGEKAWIVSIDICTINDDGNLLDAAGLAALAAMQDAVYPYYDGTELDYRRKTDQKLPLTKLPIAVTVYKLGESLFVDPALVEERTFDVRLTVTTMQGGVLCALQKGGDGSLTLDEIRKMVELGTQKAEELRKHLR
jgi:exosome complex component RRP42